MNKSSFKTVKISPELHKLIKVYCVSNNLKMNEWIEFNLKKIINKYTN